jgi:hypothetical protein
MAWKCCVFFELRTESKKIIQTNFGFRGLNKVYFHTKLEILHLVFIRIQNTWTIEKGVV